jgi:catalase (peroxidase I)
MRFEPESIHGANNGLHIARGLMEEIKKEFDWISYGDLWTLAGVAAVQVCNSFTALNVTHLRVGNGRPFDPVASRSH